MRHLAVLDVAARFQHLEPADLPEGARGTADGILDRVFDAVLRGTGNLDDPVDIIVISPWPSGDLTIKTPAARFSPARPHLRLRSTLAADRAEPRHERELSPFGVFTLNRHAALLLKPPCVPPHGAFPFRQLAWRKDHPL
jgi:hypothetical protein